MQIAERRATLEEQLSDATPKAIDGSHQVRHDLVLVRFIILGAECIRYAAPHMVFQHQQADTPRGRNDGGKLGQDVEAVLVPFNHPLHTTYLALHAAQARQDLGLVVGIGGGADRCENLITLLGVRLISADNNVAHNRNIPLGGRHSNPRC